MLTITWLDLAPLYPELFMLGATCALLLADLFITQQRRGLTHFLAIGILVAMVILTLRPQGVQGPTPFDTMFVRDGMADLLKLAIYVVTIVVFVYAKPYLKQRDLFQGEFYLLVLFGVLGMMFMVSAASMLTLYLGLELFALTSYALVGMNRDSGLSSEAAMKYFILGALASGMLLYGMSMVYGATGSLNFNEIASAAAVVYDKRLMLALGLCFIMVGIAFKFGAAPFHMWLPDVYQGSPTAVTLYVASAPKIAAVGMAYRMLETGLGPLQADWQTMLAVLSVASLVIGNLVAIMQTNFKRMLAYSTISQMGFLFMGLLAGDAQGYAAAMFYAITYALATAAAFGLIVLLARSGFEADQIDDFKGLAQRNPWYALILVMVMASLAGIPIWVGFVAKLAVLKAAVSAGFLWLAIVGGAFAVIGAFYYLRVIKVALFDEPVHGDALPLPTDIVFRGVLTANGLLLLALGMFSDPLLAWCLRTLGH
jgi:NADH-quinone oxidoreductase subunit N